MNCKMKTLRNNLASSSYYIPGSNMKANNLSFYCSNDFIAKQRYDKSYHLSGIKEKNDILNFKLSL